MQKSSLNLRHVKPAYQFETPTELAKRYGLPLAPSYTRTMHFAVYMPICAMPRGTATLRDSANA